MDLLPVDISTYGHMIDELTWLITVLGGIALLIAEGALIYAVIAYRARDGKQAKYIKGETWAEAKWVLIPVIVIACIDFYIDILNHEAWATIKQDIPESELTVTVTGQQFSWEFGYPGKDGMFGTDDDVTSLNNLYIPVDTNVTFLLRARDVLHSFFVPAMRLKQDAVPGRTIAGWFNATQTGEYEIACAEICGTGHALMKANMIIQPKDEFHSWLDAKMNPKPAGKVTIGGVDVAAAEALMTAKGCLGCHTTTGAKLVGPSYKDIFGRETVVVTDGQERTITVDEEYLRRSIKEPMADLVKDFPPAMPPVVLTDDELDLIVSYLKVIGQEPDATAAADGGADDEAVKALMTSKACLGCHSLDGSRLVGPSYLGIFGRETTIVTDGEERTITVDEDYIRRAITQPMADVVKGFPPAMPPQNLTDEELDQIVAFLKTLQ